MNICVVGPAYPLRGGIAHHTTLLCRHLSSNHRVDAVTFRRLYPELLFPGKSQMDPSLDAPTLRAAPLIDSINPLTWTAAARYAESLSPDLVIIEWWQPLFAPCLGSIASRLKASSPVMFICHNVLPHEGRRITVPLARWALRHGNAFVVHSEQDRRDIERLLPNIPSNLIRKTVHPEYEVFPRSGLSRSKARARLGVDGRVVLFFGLVRRYKGLMDLLEALPLIRSRGVTCLVVGEFYDRKGKYTSRIGQLRLENVVRIIDRYIPNEEVEAYFAAADVVVLPYRSATQSGVVQIAYRFERPVIATSVGGLPESVDDGGTGILVPPEYPPALAGAIDRYFDEGLESRFIEGIRASHGRFSWDRVVETIESLGAELCELR